MQKIKVELEYIINTSPNILFTCLSTPSGLSEWFANDVNIKDDTFTFFWDQSEESAKLMKSKKDSIRFQWEDDEGEDYYFQMAIKIDDLTKDVALLVTDFAEDDEVEEITLMWDNSISKLKQAIGG
ncbi:MAG: START-like domain-containing protein [Flavobacteriales bacterium]|nr:START-like domain-containing protein [Flavobacteriales bacterium]